MAACTRFRLWPYSFSSSRSWHTAALRRMLIASRSGSIFPPQKHSSGRASHHSQPDLNRRRAGLSDRRASAGVDRHFAHDWRLSTDCRRLVNPRTGSHSAQGWRDSRQLRMPGSMAYLKLTLSMRSTMVAAGTAPMRNGLRSNEAAYRPPASSISRRISISLRPS